jgi:hypothetical protein
MNNPFEILLKPTDEKATHNQKIKLVDTSGEYRIGQPIRPPIRHDNGFLDKYPKRPATAEDYYHLAKWRSKLNGAELLCNNSKSISKHFENCSGSDLSDATAAYRHFLDGGGKPRTVNYDRYLKEDASGQALLIELQKNFQFHIEKIGKDRVKFSVTSEPFHIGIGQFAPYPATENWQKSLGAHTVWVSANLAVTVNKKAEIVYSASVTIHMEDKYNFNPGSNDVKTKISDAENGRFELTGLGHQYMNYATVSRQWSWVEGTSPTLQ